MSLRAAMAAAVAAVVLVVACAVGLAVTWQEHSDDQRLDGNRAQVARQVGPLVAQLFSSDPADPTGRDRARAAVTADFARQYADVLDAEPAAGVTIVWNPVHTGISAVTDNHAEAVVSALVTQTGPDAATTTVTKVVDVQLEHSDDQWKIARADEVL